MSSKKKIDVYTCPERSYGNKTLPLEYMIAVMQAAKNGCKVEYRNIDDKDVWINIYSDELCLWAWQACDYRIKARNKTVKKEKIAPGHNPDKVTISEVGEDWRLLTKNEILARARYINLQSKKRSDEIINTDLIQVKTVVDWGVQATSGMFLNNTYRTKLSPFALAELIGATKIKNKDMVPMEIEDFPSTIWIEVDKDTYFLVLGVCNKTNGFLVNGFNGWFTLAHAREFKYRWSTDRITWHSFYKNKPSED